MALSMTYSLSQQPNKSQVSQLWAWVNAHTQAYRKYKGTLRRFHHSKPTLAWSATQAYKPKEFTMFPHRVHSDFSHTHPNSLMLLPLDLLPHYGNKSMLIVYMNGVTYMFIQHNNVYLMSASRQNCNVSSHLLFLHRIVDVSKPAALHFLFDSKRVVIPFTSRKLCEF